MVAAALVAVFPTDTARAQRALGIDVLIELSGYGDQAYYDGYASFSVLKGSTYVRIAVSPAGAAPSLSDEEKLMDDILPSL